MKLENLLGYFANNLDLNMRLFVISLLITCTLIPVVYAQPYVQSNAIPVSDLQGSTLANAWAGGMNSPQFSMLDMDKDGNKDLVVFERGNNRFSVYLFQSEGDLYQFDPSASASLNLRECFGWALFEDFDCDGQEDLFCGKSNANIKVFRQTGDERAIDFELAYDPLFSVYSSPNRLFSAQIDLPAIVDIDYDGDLDFLTFGNASNYVELHRNFAVERTGNCDSLIFERVTRCWGHFFESESDNTATLEDTVFCPLPEGFELPGGDLRHTGSTLLLLDLNADSLYDALVGDRSFPEIYALYNRGTLEHAYIDSIDTRFPRTSTPVDVSVFPASFLVDLYEDGQKDLLVAPNTEFDLIEDQRGVQHYVDISEDDTPNFVLEEKGFLQRTQIDAGKGAYPHLWDYDQDGVLDLLVGNESLTLKNSQGILETRSRLQLYRNVGSNQAPHFQLLEEDWLDLGALERLGLAPCSGDLDGDGDLDILVGTDQGNLLFIENRSQAGMTPSYALISNNYQGIDVDAFSAPFLADIDQDQDLDLLVGNRRGFIALYENVGSAQEATFTLITEEWGSIKISNQFNSLSNGWAKPTLWDYDQDGEKELLVGDVEGRVQVYKNLGEALSDTLEFVEILFQADVGQFAAPAVAVLDSSEKASFLIGNRQGGIVLFQDKEALLSTSINGDRVAEGLKVFPNPSTGLIQIEGHEHSLTNGSIRVFNLWGQELHRETGKTLPLELDLTPLGAGIYFLQLEWGNQLFMRKIILQD